LTRPLTRENWACGSFGGEIDEPRIGEGGAWREGGLGGNTSRKTRNSVTVMNRRDKESGITFAGVNYVVKESPEVCRKSRMEPEG